MSGALAGLYNPDTGLVGNRNDPRYAMAQKLMDQNTPAAIPGAGATWAVIAGNVAKAFAAQKLMGDAKQDGIDAAERQRQDAADTLASWGMGPDGTPKPQAGPPASAAPAPAAPAAPDPSSAPATPGTVPDSLLPIYQRASQASGVPLPVLLAKDFHESGFDPNRKGAAGENGIPQILPSTGAKPGYDMQPISEADARDPAKAIPWGAQYLANRAKAAGVTDWSDPAQQQRGYAAYNGTGPRAAQYGATVAGLVPQFASVGAPAPAAPPAAADGGSVPPAAPAASGPALAAKLGDGSDGTTPAAMGAPDDGAKGPAPAALAARLTPEGVAQLQARAVAAASSGNPILLRVAPVLQAQAQQAAVALDRQQRAQDLADDRALVAQQQRDAAAERQRTALDARVPPGYQWNGDHTAMSPVPGGPMDPANPANAPQPATPKTIQTAEGVFLQNPDGTLGTRLGGLPSQADKNMPDKPVPPKMASGILGNIGTLRNIDQAIDQVRSNPDAFGVQNYLPGGVVQRMDPAGVAARAAVQNVGAGAIHDQFGARITAQEYQRTNGYVPQLTDNPDKIVQNLQRLRDHVAANLQDQYTAFGPGSGYRPMPGHAAALGLDDGAAPAASAAPPAPPASPPLPTVTQNGRSMPEAGKLQDGQRYTLPNGAVARFDARRQTFTTE